MNFLNSLSGSGKKIDLPNFLKDSDNVLILALLLILMKEKANQSLIIALMSILMQGVDEVSK